ncbi:hypothetical protein [Phenylobacterium sp.]|jgi:hypothetical protein|uniref:hypothetical protein n=1 Tax=Phenylobacterium sp. TaxID=1871053 RepID=UPI002F3E2D8A
MVSSLKGETGFSIEGQEFVLVFDVYGLSAMEGRLELSAGEVVAKLSQNPPLKLIAAVLWTGLRERHPNITEEDAMAFIPHMGTIIKAVTLCINAISSVFPTAGEGDDADPRKAAADGTGSGYSAPGAVSASVRRTRSGSKPRASST